jgi:hypothetical protein
MKVKDIRVGERYFVNRSPSITVNTFTLSYCIATILSAPVKRGNRWEVAVRFERDGQPWDTVFPIIGVRYPEAEAIRMAAAADRLEVAMAAAREKAKAEAKEDFEIIAPFLFEGWTDEAIAWRRNSSDLRDMRLNLKQVARIVEQVKAAYAPPF